jgi:hypothetical protein
LRNAFRAALGTDAADPKYASEWQALDARIDQIALFGFDIYVRNRERLYELRVNEVKRNVAALLRKWDEDGSGSGPAAGCDAANTSACRNTCQGGVE